MINYKEIEPDNKFTKYTFESEDEKDVNEALVAFNKQIEDITVLKDILGEIAICTTHLTELVVNNPLFIRSDLVGHLISIVLDKDIPENIITQAIYAISPLIDILSEEQIDSLIDSSFIQRVFELYIYYFEHLNDLNGDRILLFLSNLASNSIKARDEVINNFPIIEKEQEFFSSLESRTIEVFHNITDNILHGIYTKSHLIFFKCLCYHPLNRDLCGVSCAISIKLLKRLPISDYDDAFKVLRYACKNGFTDLVASMNSTLFPIFLRPTFYKKCTLNSLKTLTKILKTMVDCNIDLSNLNFKELCKCITDVESNKSIFILDIIDYLISDDYIVTEQSSSVENTNQASELKNTYLEILLEKNNGLFYKLKSIINPKIDPNLVDFPIKHKIASLKILKTIIFKNKFFINKIVKDQFVGSIVDVIELQDIEVTKNSLSALLTLMHNCSDQGIIWSVISQIHEINGYKILLDIKNDMIQLNSESQDKVYEEIYQMADEAIKMIDSVNEKDITEYGKQILDSDDDDTDFICDITENKRIEIEKEQNDDCQYIHEIESVLKKYLNLDDHEEEEEEADDSIEEDNE